MKTRNKDSSSLPAGGKDSDQHTESPALRSACETSGIFLNHQRSFGLCYTPIPREGYRALVVLMRRGCRGRRLPCEKKASMTSQMGDTDTAPRTKDTEEKREREGGGWQLRQAPSCDGAFFCASKLLNNRSAQSTPFPGTFMA